MAEVFAGFLCGYISALILTPLMALLLLRLRMSSALVARLLAPGTSAVGLMVILHLGMVLFWTGAGSLLGLMLMTMNGGHPSRFLLSRNPAFSLFIFGLAVAALAPIVVSFAGSRGAAVVAGSLVVLLFGWLMPYLAAWSNFG